MIDHGILERNCEKAWDNTWKELKSFHSFSYRHFQIILEIVFNFSF